MGRYKYILLILILAVFCMQAASLAGEKTLYIKGSNIKRSGTPVNITNQANFKFTKNGTAISLYVVGSMTTTITDFAINSGTVYETSVNGRAVQINNTVQGDNYACTIWTPNVGAGNYYNSTSIAMNSANWPNSTLIWSWEGLAIDYKAEKPYKPKISSYVETQTSYPDSTTSSSSLTVNSAAGTGTDGLREVNGYAWKMWNKNTESEPTDPLTGATSQNLVLASTSLTPGATYMFRVQYKNQWGDSDWSDAKEYTLGEGGGAASFTFDLKALEEGKMVINSIASPNDTTAIAVKDAVNTAAGSNVVMAISKWDPDTGKSVTAAFDTAGSLLDGSADFPIGRGIGIQVYTTQAVPSLTL